MVAADGTKRRHSWGSVAAAAQDAEEDEASRGPVAEGAELVPHHVPRHRTASASSGGDSSDDEWPGHKVSTIFLKSARSLITYLLVSMTFIERGNIIHYLYLTVQVLTRE